jgi:hypothetical protein
VHALCKEISIRPVVTSTTTLLGDVNILRIEKVPVVAVLDLLDNTGLEVEEECARDVVLVVSLGEDVVVGGNGDESRSGDCNLGE